MNYIPLARKYRPQTFEDLIGQPHVTTTLARAIETKRIGQAYLFTGQRGVGKTSAARILAKGLNCAEGPTARPCQRCPSCAAIQTGSSFDVIEIDGASNRGIDDIRQLREQVKFAPVHGQFRVYIIDEVHQITTDAFNALLKTLEEPPAHVKFIFATTAPQKVPPTILSRCQRFDFRRLDAKTIVETLTRISKSEKIAIEEAALYAIARACEGSLRDAEVILEQLVSFSQGGIREEDVSQLLGAVEQETLLAWTQALLDGDANAALQLLTQQLDRGKDITQLLVGLLMHLRNLLILRTTADSPSRKELREQLVDVPAEQLTRLEEQAGQVSPEDLLLMAQLLTGAYELSRRSPFAQAIVEFALIKLAARESWTSLEQVLQRLERIGQGPSRGIPAPADDPSTPSRAPAPIPTPRPIEGASVPLVADAPNVSPRASAGQPHMDPPTGAASAATAIADVVPLETVNQQWPLILERIGEQKMSLAAYLTDARPVAVSDRSVHIGIPGFSLHQEVLGLPENLRLVERILGDILGQRVSVEYVTLPEPIPGAVASGEPQSAGQSASTAPATSSTPVPPIVQDIVKLFDATIIQPPPSP